MQRALEIAGAVAVLAGGVAGGIYLWARARRAGVRLVRFFDERRRIHRIMADLTRPGAWPNGSNSIAGAVDSLYGKVSTIELAVNELTRSVEIVLQNSRAE